jgi:hypothetical protein
MLAATGDGECRVPSAATTDPSATSRSTTVLEALRLALDLRAEDGDRGDLELPFAGGGVRGAAVVVVGTGRREQRSDNSSASAARRVRVRFISGSPP